MPRVRSADGVTFRTFSTNRRDVARRKVVSLRIKTGSRPSYCDTCNYGMYAYDNAREEGGHVHCGNTHVPARYACTNEVAVKNDENDRAG